MSASAQIIDNVWSAVGVALLLLFIRWYMQRQREDIKGLGTDMENGFIRLHQRMDKAEERHSEQIDTLRRESQANIKEALTAIQTVKEDQLKQHTACVKEFIGRDEHEKVYRRVDQRLNNLERKESKSCA